MHWCIRDGIYSYVFTFWFVDWHFSSWIVCYVVFLCIDIRYPYTMLHIIILVSDYWQYQGACYLAQKLRRAEVLFCLVRLSLKRETAPVKGWRADFPIYLYAWDVHWGASASPNAKLMFNSISTSFGTCIFWPIFEPSSFRGPQFWNSVETILGPHQGHEPPRRWPVQHAFAAEQHLNGRDEWCNSRPELHIAMGLFAHRWS